MYLSIDLWKLRYLLVPQAFLVEAVGVHLYSWLSTAGSGIGECSFVCGQKVSTTQIKLQ